MFFKNTSLILHAAVVLILLSSSCSGKKNISKRKTQEREKTSYLMDRMSQVDHPDKTEAVIDFLMEFLELKFKDFLFNQFLYVSAKQQQIYLVENGKVATKYPVSTAKKGLGSKESSEQTPKGLHTVHSKYGDHVPKGGLLISREYTGQQVELIKEKIDTPNDYITSRILWLKGEEKGVNKGRNIDSYKRYIYIHGTSEEGLIGQPASHGCIRMLNNDVIELYDKIPEGTPVIILSF